MSLETSIFSSDCTELMLFYCGSNCGLSLRNTALVTELMEERFLPDAGELRGAAGGCEAAVHQGGL